MEDKIEDKEDIIEIKKPNKIVPNMFKLFVLYIFVALLMFFIYINLYEPEVRQIGVSTSEDSITETTENTTTENIMIENILSVDFDVEI